jgi:hypothetical protein
MGQRLGKHHHWPGVLLHLQGFRARETYALELIEDSSPLRLNSETIPSHVTCDLIINPSRVTQCAVIGFASGFVDIQRHL